MKEFGFSLLKAKYVERHKGKTIMREGLPQGASISSIMSGMALDAAPILEYGELMQARSNGPGLLKTFSYLLHPKNMVMYADDGLILFRGNYPGEE